MAELSRNKAVGVSNGPAAMDNKDMLTGKKIGFIGAGSMAQALLDGLVGGRLVAPDQVTVTNRGNEQRLHSVRDRWQVQVTRDRHAVVDQAEVVILACKPADSADVLAAIGPRMRRSQVLISVMAGITTATVEAYLPEGTAVVRAMPNTSSRVRESATALSGGCWAGPDALAVAEAVFASVGRVVRVPEEQMDAVTAVSGSGPAYIYLVTEALIRAGVAEGLAPETAWDLVVQTVLGAALTLQQSGEDPSSLRQAVTSPNGTTAAALAVLEERGFAASLVEAVARAAARSRELASFLSGPAGDEAGDGPAPEQAENGEKAEPA